MTNTITEFKIIQIRLNGSCTTKIENNTINDCIIQLVPAPPKRKRIDCLVVKSDSYYIIEQQELDLCKIGIIFKND